MLHLIREARLEQAIAHYPEVDDIPQRNIALMEQLGATHHQQVLQDCFQQRGDDE